VISTALVDAWDTSLTQPCVRGRAAGPLAEDAGLRAAEARSLAQEGRSLGQEARSLAQLMARYADGDDRVFEGLYRVLSPRVRRFCRRIASHAQEADDVFQDTFLRLHRARATYARGASVLPWVLAIARSAHLDRLKYRSRRPESVGDANDASEDGGLCADVADDPEAQALARGLDRIVSTALDDMSERNRLAYVLVEEEGLSVREAAAVLGTTTSVVKQRTHRAREHLRAAVQSAGWTEDTHGRRRNAASVDR
jgi:RNA polymerase sigma-70 factor (ECF subfamily)